MMASEPYPKERQLSRGTRRYTRLVASPKRLQQIIDAKMGPCRVCGGTGMTEFHHLVPRSQGGGDTESNFVPLCHRDHMAVTNGDKTVCAALRRNLTDAEYSYAVEKLGEARFESRYPVVWEKP
jgi:5-methylcytosine-specific restriction endonuclease McrA